MLVLSCKNIEKSFGTNVILEDISFNIRENDKIGLVGRNGSGKTTLFNIIAGKSFYDKGEIYLRKDLNIGYLTQHTVVESKDTIFQECLKVFSHLIDMEEQIRILEKNISLAAENNSDNLNKLMDEYSQLSENFTKSNGYSYRSSIKGALIGLGFEEDEFYKEVNLLSGGEKSRVALAKMLLENPHILLLDEPTNHLDIEATDWLAKYIKDYKGAVLIISHDRYFLDQVVNRIFHLDNNRIEEYDTNYTNFIRRRKENLEVYKKQYQDQQQEIKRQKKIIEQYQAYGGERYNRLAKSRQKMLDKIQVMDRYQEESIIRFKFKPKIESGNDVISVKNLEKSFPGRKLFTNVNFNIYKGEKIGLIGPNGVGKSTLFRLILDELDDYNGLIDIGHQVNIGYFEQEMSNLNLDNIVIDEIWDDNPKLTHTQVRTILSQFMFFGDDVFKEIRDLSGGERGRLSILKLMMSKANFLLMDEPTNHLDIDSKEVLEQAILDYEGTLFVISHDRYFLNRVVDKIFLMTSEGIEQYLGNYDYYLEKINEDKEDAVDLPDKTKTEIQKERRREKDQIKERKKEAKEIKKLENQILENESLIEEIDEKLSDNSIYEDTELVIELTESREKVSSLLEDLYNQWISLTES